MFLSKFIYVIDHKTNGRTFFTNHNNAGFGLIAYNIYVRVILALSPKMAPITKTKWNQGPEHTLIIVYSIGTVYCISLGAHRACIMYVV